MDTLEFTEWSEVKRSYSVVEKLRFLTEDDDLETCVLELCRTVTIKPKQIECSVFFILDKNSQTQI